MAADIVFVDTSQAAPVRDLYQWMTTAGLCTSVTMVNHPPITDIGWAVVRWTAIGMARSGDTVSVPGATMIEERGGRIVRMTLYYDSSVLPLTW